MKEHYFSLLLILSGLFLRILFIQFNGLSNDELSAIIRLNYSSFNDLIEKGVKNNDMHPALYQIFLWFWSMIFGISEWSIRIVSLLFYLINSFLIYKICLKYFSKCTGEIVLLFYFGFSLSIIHQTFSRPYLLGTTGILFLMFGLIENYKSKEMSFKSFFLIVLGLLISMYSHYFAFLASGILAFVFFVISKNKLKLILITFIVLISFYPHIKITLFHLSHGGLTWLGIPKWTWLFDFFILYFNSSLLIFIIFIIIVIYSFYKIYKIRFVNFNLDYILLFIFFTQYLISYLLSVFYTPILREPAMFFVLPLFFIPLSNFLSKTIFFNYKLKWIFYCLIIFHLIFINKFYSTYQFPVFREIGLNGNDFELNNKKKSIHYISNFCNVNYINYYRKTKLKEYYDKWGGAETPYYLYNRTKKIKDDYVIYQYSNNAHNSLYIEAIRLNFPFVYKHFYYLNSSFTVFSKSKIKNIKLLKHKVNFRKININIESNLEFFGDIKLPAKCLISNSSIYYTFEATTKNNINDDFYLVVVSTLNNKMLEDENSKMYIAWNQKNTVDNKQKQKKIIVSFELPKKINPNAIIHFYFWNPSKMTYKIDNLKLYKVYFDGN